MTGAPDQRDWNLLKEENPNREKARVVKARQRAIGRELRRMYDNIAQEAIPDELVDLLKRIDQADRSPERKAL